MEDTQPVWVITHGDADGLTSAYQRIREDWDFTEDRNRQSVFHDGAYEPQTNFEIVSGKKTQIGLVNEVADKVAPGSTVLVMDLSSRENTLGLMKLKKKGAKVHYIDHHEPAENLDDLLIEGSSKVINTDKTYNTSTIINEGFRNRYVEWAIVGAYGDNLIATAEKLAKEHGIQHQEDLRQVANILNYNSCSEGIAPDQLLKNLLRYNSPIDFLRSDLGQRLNEQYVSAKKQLSEVSPIYSNDFEIYLLPDSEVARALFPIVSNDMQGKSPSKTHIVLVPFNNTFTVSIRAPQKANEIAKKLGGGGRETAAGASIPKIENPVAYLLSKLHENS